MLIDMKNMRVLRVLKASDEFLTLHKSWIKSHKLAKFNKDLTLSIPEATELDHIGWSIVLNKYPPDEIIPTPIPRAPGTKPNLVPKCGMANLTKLFRSHGLPASQFHQLMPEGCGNPDQTFDFVHEGLIIWINKSGIKQGRILSIQLMEYTDNI